MAIDLEAIRRKVQELNGVRRNSNIQLWKPGLGEHKVRGMQWKNSVDGMPFIERHFYYIGKNRGIMAPYQFGKPDPIEDFRRKLYQSGTPEDRNLAKKLQSKMRAYMPVIVRGEESKGVQVWSFGKIVYQRLLGFFTDSDVGDILDPLEGFDLKVTLSQSQGKQYQDTVVDAARRQSKMMDDTDVITKLLDSVPNIDDMYPLKSASEIEAILSAWLNSGAPDGDGVTSGPVSDGTLVGSAPNDALEQLANDVKSTKVEEPATKTPKKGAKKPAVDDEDTIASPKGKANLDAAFDELMQNEA
jgi:hypothetical protein